MLLTEFNMKDAQAVWREEGREEGMEVGRVEGREKERTKMFEILKKFGYPMDKIKKQLSVSDKKLAY